MIDYQTFHQIRQLCDQEHLSVAQIAAALHLDERTVSKWIDVQNISAAQAGSARQQARSVQRHHRPAVGHSIPYTAQQLLQRLKEGGYTGGYTILKEYVRTVRPPRRPLS